MKFKFFSCRFETVFSHIFMKNFMNFTKSNVKMLKTFKAAIFKKSQRVFVKIPQKQHMVGEIIHVFHILKNLMNITDNR